MNTPPAPLLLSLLVHAALASVLPAPVGLCMDSVNFRHILRWRPGPGTPPGTRYIISRDREGRKRPKWLANSTTTWVQLCFKDPQDFYYLRVVASYNQSVSPAALLRFTPYEETIIGPPAVSLVGCGNCLHVSVSLPVADSSSKVDNIYIMFDPSFRVVYKKSGGKEITYRTINRNFTLSNLHRGTEYCLQVHTLIRVNQNTKPSNWTCASTSSQEPSRASAVVATVTVVGIVVLVGLMATTLCLYSTGFLCKLKDSLPRAQRAALNRGYTLTPEKIIPNMVSVSPPTGNQRRHNNLTVPQAATGGTEEEEEEEEEKMEEDERTLYVNKATMSVAGDGVHEDSDEEEVSRTPAVAECSSCSMEEPKNEVTEEETPFPTEGTPTEVRVHVTEEEVQENEEKDYSGDVDLFSVTLATLAVCEKEEENTGDEASSGVLPLHADTESHDKTAEDPGGAWTQCGDTEEEEEQEEEEEEFSGYMRHP